MTRYISRILCAVLAVMLLISVLPGTASAAEYTLTKGQPGDVPFGMMAEADCEYKLYGQIPGMSLEQFRGAKLIAFKMKRRKGYRRRKGHRQELTKVKITSIA